MNTENDTDLHLSAVNLCEETLRSAAKNDIANTLSLFIATISLCVKCSNSEIISEVFFKDIPKQPKIPFNKSLVALSCLAYQALFFLSKHEYILTIKTLLEACDLFNISRSGISDFVTQQTSINDILNLSKKLISDNSKAIKENIRNA